MDGLSSSGLDSCVAAKSSFMRIITRLALLTAAVIAGVGPLAAPASAESFFEKLFGFGARPTRSQPNPPYRSNPVHPVAPAPLPEAASPDHGSPAHRHAERTNGHYRTVCVRACDGYYWPISASATRQGIHRDADLCKSSCSSEAHLFYQDYRASDTSTLVDLTGRSYTRLANAFRYRRALVPGCSCKPEPWSAAAMMRHRQYSQLPGPAPGPAIATSPSHAGNALPVASGPVTERAQQALLNVGQDADTPQSLGVQPAEHSILPAGTPQPATPSFTITGRRTSAGSPGTPGAEIRSKRFSPENRRRTPSRWQPSLAASRPNSQGFGQGSGTPLRWPGD